MLKLIYHLGWTFLWDEAAMRRWVYGAAATLATSGVAYAEDLAGSLGSPEVAKYIKVACVVCAFFIGTASPKK